MHVERLRKWAAVLREVPPRQFDMNSWTCGSVACAAGWACTVPEFVADGLRLDAEFWCPTFESAEDYEAISLFFGIDEEEAIEICDPDNYRDLNGDCRAPTPAEVADRIESLIAETP